MDWKVLDFSLSLSFSLFLSLSLSFSDYLPTYLLIYLSISLSIYLSIYLPINLSIYLSIYRSIYLSIHPSIYLSIYPSTYLSIYLSVCLSIYLSIYLCLTVCLFVCLSVYLPDWKRSSSARLPHFSNLTTTTKTKQFCNTSFRNYLGTQHLIHRDTLTWTDGRCTVCSTNPRTHAQDSLFVTMVENKQDSNPGPNLTQAKPEPHLWFTQDQPASVYPRRGEFSSP